MAIDNILHNTHNFLPITKLIYFIYSLYLWELFLTLLAQNFFGVITYSREELLDIRTAVTHQHYQHYDQEYNSRSGSFVRTPQGNRTDSRGRPKTTLAGERYSEWISSLT